MPVVQNIRQVTVFRQKIPGYDPAGAVFCAFRELVSVWTNRSPPMARFAFRKNFAAGGDYSGISRIRRRDGGRDGRRSRNQAKKGPRFRAKFALLPETVSTPGSPGMGGGPARTRTWDLTVMSGQL